MTQIMLGDLSACVVSNNVTAAASQQGKSVAVNIARMSS